MKHLSDPQYLILRILDTSEVQLRNVEIVQCSNGRLNYEQTRSMLKSLLQRELVNCFTKSDMYTPSKEFKVYNITGKGDIYLKAWTSYLMSTNQF